MDKENSIPVNTPGQDVPSSQKRRRGILRQPTFTPQLLSLLSTTHENDTTWMHVTASIKQQLSLDNVNRALNSLFTCCMTHKQCETKRDAVVDLYDKVLNYYSMQSEGLDILSQLKLQKIVLMMPDVDQETTRENLKTLLKEAYISKSLTEHALFFALFAQFEVKCNKPENAKKMLHHRSALASKPIQVIQDAQQLLEKNQLQNFDATKYFAPLPPLVMPNVSNMPTATMSMGTSTGSSNSTGSGELEATVVGMSRTGTQSVTVPGTSTEGDVDMAELLQRIRKRKEMPTNGDNMRARKRVKPSVSIQSPQVQPTPPHHMHGMPQNHYNHSPAPNHLHTALNTEIFIVNGKQYTKIEIIGKGGSSKVFKCFDPDKKIVALKRVKLEGHDESSLNGFINEVELLAKLRGKSNIIQLIDHEVNHETSTLSIVMECGEADLNTLLRNSRGKLSGNHIRLYWQQMLEAVHTVHEARIVHGDLKPANFLLVRGTLKLIDFGIAKAIRNDTTNIVRDSQVGTPNYISPEALQVNASQKQYKLGRPSDIWSLGCILYQMIYGKTPFADVPHLINKIQAITDNKHVIPFPAQSNNLPVDSAVIDVLSRCLVRDPQRRVDIPTLLKHAYLVPNMISIPSVEIVIQDLLKLNSVDAETASIITRELVERLVNNNDVQNVVAQLVPKRKN
jgi:serine/threonine-protein kinase TTK/MPS1